MAQHIDGGQNIPMRLDFPNSELPETFIEISWEFGEPGSQDKAAANRVARQSVI